MLDTLGAQRHCAVTWIVLCNPIQTTQSVRTVPFHTSTALHLVSQSLLSDPLPFVPVPVPASVVSMSADQQQFYAKLTDSVRQSLRVDFAQAVEASYHRVGQELRPGYEQVADLTQQLAAPQAKIDSLERLQR